MKQGIKITILIFLLFLIVLSPFGVLEYQSRRLLERKFYYQLESPVSSELNLNPWERYELIKDAVTVVVTSNYMDLSFDDTLFLEMENQLNLLVESHAIPRLSFGEKMSAIYSQRTYMGNFNPEACVRVWVIRAQYETFEVTVLMDEETKMLYAVSIDTKDENEFLYENGVSQGGYLNYLQSFDENQEELETFVHTKEIYESKRIRLSIISTDN